MNPSKDIVEISIGGASLLLLGVSGDTVGTVADEAESGVAVVVVRKSARLSNLTLRLVTTLLSSSNLLLTMFVVLSLSLSVFPVSLGHCCT